MNSIKLQYPEFTEDSKRIQEILLTKGYELSLSDSESLWVRYSDSLCASWMTLPTQDADVFNVISTYLHD